jgi:Flp pilus assembly protein CpaB
MNPTSAQQRAFLAALFLLGTTLSVSGCSLVGSSRATKPEQPEQTGMVVYAIKDIPEGYEISTEALEERELSYSKIPQDAITSASLAHGRNAKYGIAQGQIVSQHDLAPHRAGHTVNVALSDAAYNQIRRIAADSGQTESALVSAWIEEKLNRQSKNDE